MFEIKSANSANEVLMVLEDFVKSCKRNEQKYEEQIMKEERQRDEINIALEEIDPMTDRKKITELNLKIMDCNACINSYRRKLENYREGTALSQEDYQKIQALLHMIAEKERQKTNSKIEKLYEELETAQKEYTSTVEAAEKALGVLQDKIMRQHEMFSFPATRLKLSHEVEYDCYALNAAINKLHNMSFYLKK